MDLNRKRSTVPRLRGLPATRHGAVLLALVCAVLAAIILVVALGSYRSSLNNSNKQETVLVSTGLIQKGTSGAVVGAQNLVKPLPVVLSKATAGALTNATQLHGEVAAQDILPGQQLTASDFTPGGGYAGELAPGQRAVEVSLDSSHGLTDVLQVGDHVDVYASYTYNEQGDPYYSHLFGGGTSSTAVSTSAGATSSSAGAPNSAPVVRLLIPNATVLKVGGSAAGLGAGGGAGAGVVLAIGDDDVAALEWSYDNGKVWLSLRPANALKPNSIVASADTVLYGFHFTLITTVQANQVIFHHVYTESSGGH